MTSSSAPHTGAGKAALVALVGALSLLVFVSLRGEDNPPASPPLAAPAAIPSPATALPATTDSVVTAPTFDESTGFVIDDGWELVASQCTACHGAKLVTQNRGDEDYWRGLIRWMQETQSFWPLAPEVEQQIVGYLAKHYGAVGFGRRPPLARHLLPPDEAPLAASPSTGSDDDPRIARARAALAPLKKKLMGKLTAAMEQGGPVAAIDVCQLEAPAIAASASEASGVKVGRTSRKLRNPNNAPKPWMEPLLDELSRQPPTPGAFRSVVLDDGSLGYGEPIYVMPVCLRCHGEALGPEVTRALAERYPDDDATGFVQGAFRGMFWAEVPAS